MRLLRDVTHNNKTAVKKRFVNGACDSRGEKTTNQRTGTNEILTKVNELGRDAYAAKSYGQ